MLEAHSIGGKDWLAQLGIARSTDRPDLPDGVIGGLVEQADLLVA